MHYYVDHTSRFQHNTGIQRCVRSIAAALIAEGIPLRPLLWDRGHQDFVPADRGQRDHLARWNGPPPERWATDDPPAGEHWSDRWLLVVELVCGPQVPSASALRQAASRRGWRVAWVFHDAIPLRLSHLYGRRGPEVSRRHGVYMEGLALFERVFANSHTTADHLSRFLRARGHAEDRVQTLVTALPLATEFPGQSRGAPPPSRCQALWMAPGQLRRPLRLLCVGSLEPRKNHAALFKAVADLVHRRRWQSELVLVGWANDRRVVAQLQRARELGLPIRWEAQADDQRLQSLYRWCDATVYPSMEEGFGLPVAESLWQWRPCVCSGDGALGELAAEGGCLTFDSANWRALAAALEALQQQPELYGRLERELHQRRMRPWQQYAREMVEDLAGREQAR